MDNQERIELRRALSDAISQCRECGGGGRKNIAGGVLMCSNCLSWRAALGSERRLPWPLWHRLRWALKLCVWPWRVPTSYRYVAVNQRLTPSEVAHGQRLARRRGWK